MTRTLVESVVYWGVTETSSTGLVGDVLIPSATTERLVVATAANRGTRRATGIALAPYTDGGAVRVQQNGRVNVVSLGAGAAGPVRVSATGRLERCPLPATNADDIIGRCEADGTVHLLAGILTADIVNGGGGGGGGPIDLTTDVTGILPIANGGTGVNAVPGASGSVIWNSSGVYAGTDAGIKVGTASGFNYWQFDTSIVWGSSVIAAAAGGSNKLPAAFGAWLTVRHSGGGADLHALQFVAGNEMWIGSNVGATASRFTVTHIDGATVVIRGGGAEMLRANSSGVQISDSAHDHWFTLGVPDLAADRTLSLPLLTGNDTLVCQAHAAALTNKTIVASSNTITDTSSVAGDLLVHNGTRFVRLAKGTDTHVLTMTAGAVGWAAPTGGGGSVPTGTGFRRVTAGVEDAAAAAVNLAGGATHITGTLPVGNGGTGITSFGAGVATWLGTPSSANLASAITDETGTGALVFANTPSLITPKIADSAGGQFYNVAVSNLAADRTVTLPLLAANDTFVFEAFAQALTNKTINGASNTITNVSLTTGVTGTLPAGNGGTGLASPGTAGNVLTSDGTGWVSAAPSGGGGGGGGPLWSITDLTGNATTTSNSATDTGFQVTVAANERWEIEAKLTAQCSSTGGVKFAVVGPNAGDTYEGWIDGTTSGLTTRSYQRITSNALNGTALHTVANTPAPDYIRCRVVIANTGGGLLKLRFASNTNGQTSTIFAGSTFKATRIFPVGSSFDPATLTLTGWWRSSFTGSPWTPTASAGGSGSAGNFTEATNPPATGSAVNGLTPANFDGTNDCLAGPNASALLSASAYTVWILGRADTSASAGGNPWGEPGLLQHSTAGTVWGMSYADGKVRGVHYDGAIKVVEVAIAAGNYFLARMRFDGSTVGLTVNGGTENSVAAGNLSGGFAHAMFMGKNFDSSLFFDGQILEVLTASSDLSASDADVRAYVNARYGLSL